MSTKDTDVSLDLGDGLAIMELCRPQNGNALNAGMVEQCLALLDEIARSDAHTLLIRGSGKGFCGGFDLDDLESESDGSLLLRFVRIEQLLQRLADFPKRTICYAHRFAFGAGADLFCACDVRLAEIGTKFMFPGVAFGLALGTRRLAKRIGSDAAIQLLWNRTPVYAEDAPAGFVTTTIDSATNPNLVENLCQATPAIHPSASELILRRSRRHDLSGDMAALVESAAVPGLKDRIIGYHQTIIKR